VYDALAVAVLDHRQHGGGDGRGVCLGEELALDDHVKQLAAQARLHDYEDVGGVLPHLMQGHHVWVVTHLQQEQHTWRHMDNNTSQHAAMEQSRQGLHASSWTDTES
jgi:hypothetical protein